MPNMTNEELQPAHEALAKYLAAGDQANAQKIAAYIKSQQSGPATEAIESVPMHPAEMLSGAVADSNPSSWFSPNDPKDVSAKEAIGAVGGGALAGAIGGAALPGMLKVGGKFIPGPVGKLVSGVGEVAGALPLKERIVRGAGGGAAMGAVDTLGDAVGAPKALTLGAGLAAGGLGETGASFLSSTADKLARFVGNAAYGNVSGAARALGGMLSPNKALNEATAMKLQKKLFGEKTEGYVNGLTGVDNRIAVQEALRKADPSLVSGVKAPVADGSGLEPLSGELHPVSGSTDLATVGGKPAMPGGFGPATPAGPALGGPTIAMGGPATNPLVVPPTGAAAGFTKEAAAAAAADGGIPGMAAGKAGAKAKLTAAQQAQQAVDDAAAAQALKPASQIYRERMYDGVTAAVKQGKPFSATPEFQDFAQQLQDQVARQNVSPGDAASLLRKLRNDQAQGAAGQRLQGTYAEDVDNAIRQWGKPAEGATATGAAAVSAGTARDVRSALEDSFNKYTTRLGMGPVEAQYRNAYSQEMVAEAKDKLPKFLYGGLESGQEFAKMARNLAKDPQGKPFIQAAIAQHLANVAPKEAVGEFERLQSAIVSAKLLEPADLASIREGAAAIKRTADEGLKLKMGQTLKNRILLAVTQRSGVAAGGAVGAAAAAQDDSGDGQ